ncbi:MAG: energy-coupling factor transporter transmembrane component T [Candidatus Dormibacteria bacterium]
MNARALLLWVGAVLLLSLGSEDPVYRVLTLAAAAAVLARQHRPGVSLRPVTKWVGLVCVLAVGFNLLLSHTGQDVLLTLPTWLPAIGGQLTLEGAVYGGDIALGLGACLVAATTMGLVVEPQQLIDALPQSLHRTGAALGATTTLLPRLRSSFVAVREAQTMRGWRPRGLRSLRAVAVPSVLTAIEGSVLLAEAMEARGFGSGRRTAAFPTPWTWLSVAVAAGAASSITLFAFALISGSVSGWQPYPTLMVPGVSWIPTLACVMLVLPAVLG